MTELRKRDCGCGCGRFGTVNRWGCTKGCDCSRCKGRQNRKEGLRRQVRASRALGIDVSNLRPGNEERLPGALRIEVKSGAQVQPIITRFLAAQAQSEASRAIGDHRPFAFVASHERTTLVVVEESELVGVVCALAENWNRRLGP